MANLGTPLELTNKVVRNRVWRVGIELEGAWTSLPPGATPQRDGSLDEFIADLLNKGIHLASRNAEMASPILTLQDMPVWIRQMYPQHCDHPKCGLHVHMSFQDADHYRRLGDPRYPATIIEYLKRWATSEGLPADHPLWSRLRGENEYCQHIYDFVNQVQQTRKEFLTGRERRRHGSRYTFINFCYGRTRTVECRGLTMFPDPEQAIRAVQEVIRVTNGFLVATAAKEKPTHVSVGNEGPTVEEHRIYV